MFRRICISICLVVGASLFITPAVHASVIKNEENPRVASGEVVNGVFVASGENIVVEGTVSGDVFCAGNNVTISGVVEGDVLCVGSVVKISGVVMGDIRVAGGAIEIAGEAGNVTALGETITFTPMARIARDIVVAGGSVNIESHVGRDIIGSAKNITISNIVVGHVRVWTDNLTLRQGASVAGSLRYTGQNTATMEKPQIVKGQVEHIRPSVAAEVTQSAMTNVLFSLFWFAAMSLLGGALLMLHPRFLAITALRMKNKPGASLGWGIVGLVGAPLVATIALVSIIGIPLGIFILLVWAMGLLLSQLLAAHAIGLWILEKLNVEMAVRLRHFMGILIGLLIIALLGIIPFVGGLIGFVALLIGLGSLAAFFVGRKSEPEVV